MSRSARTPRDSRPPQACRYRDPGDESLAWQPCSSLPRGAGAALELADDGEHLIAAGLALLERQALARSPVLRAENVSGTNAPEKNPKLALHQRTSYRARVPLLRERAALVPARGGARGSCSRH